MNGITSEETKKLHQWVVSIAITVVCCALFFLFFAGYFLSTQEKLIEMQVRSEMQEARMNILENNLLMFGQRSAMLPITPAVPVPAPVTARPAVQAAPPSPAPAPLTPPVAEQHSAPRSPVDTMDGAALLLNTESITPALQNPEQKPQGESATKQKTKSDAEE